MKILNIKIHITLILLILFCSNISAQKIIVEADIISSTQNIPDPYLVDRIIYGFAEFNDSNDGIIIQNPEKLATICKLKNENKNLKIILGIGGDKKEGFSEAASSKSRLRKFVNSCNRIIKRYNLDGINLDWEFPTTDKGGHTCRPDDKENYVKMVKSLRQSLGNSKTISIYSNNSAAFIDFKNMMPYIDYVHVSGYNLSGSSNGKLKHHCNLYGSKICGYWSVDGSVKRHIEQGIPPEKIILGIPFFGRGTKPFPSYVECKLFDRYNDGLHVEWDDQAKAPYYTDSSGELLLGFDNEESLNEKF